MITTYFDANEHSHTRQNILTGDWVLVSPHRNKRPWQGKVESLLQSERPTYDKDCYLCPGNKRADGGVNPDYANSFVFTNDFSALLQETPIGEINVDNLLKAKSERGICKVISFSADHSLTLPLLSTESIKHIIAIWKTTFQELSSLDWIKYITIFENKGDIMGCSNPHPHGQVWAQSSLPLEVIKETQKQKQYFEQYGKSLLTDYLQLELARNERIVVENEHFVALVPYWAIWPYETMIICKRHVPTIVQFTNDETHSFACILKSLTTKYDNLFEVSFPYSAGMHQAPVNDGNHEEWHWHMHFYPPLLRSATIKKFMVGYEMLSNPQRDITPEWAAAQLKNVNDIHYKNCK